MMVVNSCQFYFVHDKKKYIDTITLSEQKHTYAYMHICKHTDGAMKDGEMSSRICMKTVNNNDINMFISYSWYNNEMVQIQMENMPKYYNTHASYKSSTQSDEGTYSLVLQTICIFDITVQQYLITCNFPNQIRQFG